MKLSCPNCGVRTFSLWDKFKAVLNSPVHCQNCEGWATRPVPLSVVALLSLFTYQANTHNDYDWIVIGAVIATVFFEYVGFELEPLPKQTRRNRERRMAVSLVAGLVLALFFFGKVLLPTA